MMGARRRSPFVAKRTAFLGLLLLPRIRSRWFRRMQMRPKLAGGLAKDAPESAIELGERLKAGVVGHLADPDIGIEQSGARTFYADARDVIGEGQSGALVEDLAEVEDARARRRRRFGERNRSGLMPFDVLPCPGHERWFLVLLLDEQLVAQGRKLFGEKSQQPKPPLAASASA